MTHSIHVWYIYLQLVDFYGKCREIYHTWMVWVRNHFKYIIQRSFVYKMRFWSIKFCQCLAHCPEQSFLYLHFDAFIKRFFCWLLYLRNWNFMKRMQNNFYIINSPSWRILPVQHFGIWNSFTSLPKSPKYLVGSVFGPPKGRTWGDVKVGSNTDPHKVWLEDLGI